MLKLPTTADYLLKKENYYPLNNTIKLLCTTVTVLNLIELERHALAGTIIAFGFRMITRIIKALVCVTR